MPLGYADLAVGKSQHFQIKAIYINVYRPDRISRGYIVVDAYR